VSRNFTLTVSLSNAEKVYGFEFDLSWNATYLESNIQCLTIGSLFPPPYETLVEQIDNTAGTAHVVVVRPCEKAPVTAHEDITAATLCFHDIFVQPNPLNPIIQYPYNSSISITHALIYAKCPAPVTYTSTATTSTYAGVFTGTGPQSGVLASETYAKATDDGKYLYLTVGLTNPIDYVWFSGGVEALITYGTTNIGVLFDPSLHYFAYPYAYYNGTTWNNASDVATHFNFTVSGSQALGYYTFKIPFANLPNYLGQTISSTLYWWDGSFANYMWSTTAFSYNRQLLVKVNPAVKYIWTPNIYDLNLDCNVDMGDLSALLKVYGSTTSNWAALVASNPTIVDIYDFVIVAKHVGIDP
jgi:hypothetical protein